MSLVGELGDRRDESQRSNPGDYQRRTDHSCWEQSSTKHEHVFVPVHVPVSRNPFDSTGTCKYFYPVVNSQKKFDDQTFFFFFLASRSLAIVRIATFGVSYVGQFLVCFPRSTVNCLVTMHCTPQSTFLLSSWPQLLDRGVLLSIMLSED